VTRNLCHAASPLPSSKWYRASVCSSASKRKAGVKSSVYRTELEIRTLFTAQTKSEAQLVQTSNRREQRPPDANELSRDHGNEPVAAEGDDAETELAKLLSASSRLCLTEDAGAAKSGFTRRSLAHRGCLQRDRKSEHWWLQPGRPSSSNQVPTPRDVEVHPCS
jgi:hypothetical protein